MRYYVGLIKHDQPDKGTTCVAEIIADKPLIAAQKYAGRGYNYAASKYLKEAKRAIIVVMKRGGYYDRQEKAWLFDVDYFDREIHLVHPYYPE